ncbi:hypothetical protein [Nonomuraea sp. NPDC049784]|uniref:hypothetical protein n=1 Tax=Nonomuraea sp. NPDC049784 TaxID=3154361 RepID=UPI0033BFE842
MSTNERDWFSPRNDPRREEEPPPPPPSQEPPPGLGSHSGPGTQPPGRGRHSGHALPPEHGTGSGQGPYSGPGMESGEEVPPGAETAPVPRVPSGGELPGRGMPQRHGGRRGRGTPPPGYDALEGQPSGPQDALGWPSAPQDAPQWPSAPQDALEWPSAPQEAPERPSAPRGPMRAQGQGQGVAPRHGAPQSRARHTQSDQQVWPPAPREPVGGVTQPLPAVQGPLSFEPQQSAPPSGPPMQAAAATGMPHQPPGEGPSDASPDAPQAADRGSRRAAAPGARRKRMLLIAAGAVIVSLITTAAHSYDGYLFYEKVSTKETKVTIVPAGQAGKVSNIEYRATIAPTKAPEGSTTGPEVAWLKVDITKKALDEGSATKTAKPGDVQMEDRAGRTWVVENDWVGDPPIDRMVVGKEYKILGVAKVPASVANEVELSFRPSNYRSDTPTEDLFKKETVAKLEKDIDVLRFRRR